MKQSLVPLFALMILVGGCRLGRGGATGYYKAIQTGQESEKEPRLLEGTDLEIRGNGTFLLRGFPQLEGRAEVQGDLVLLTIEKAGGKPVGDLRKGSEGEALSLPPIRLRLADGGVRLNPDAENKNPIKFSWVRAER